MQACQVPKKNYNKKMKEQMNDILCHLNYSYQSVAFCFFVIMAVSVVNT